MINKILVLFGLMAAVSSAMAAIRETNFNDDKHIRVTREAEVIDSAAAKILNLDMNTTDPRRQMENRNKLKTWHFMNDYYGNKNIDALDVVVSPEKYIQHDPNVGDGLEMARAATKVFFKNQPKEKACIPRIAADGDLVWVHWKWLRVETDNKNGLFALVDIFRFENDKIVEHWNVNQEIPEKAANDHPMF